MSQEMNDYLREIERNIRLNDAKKEGLKEGIEKGIELNKHDMIIELHKKNISLDIISEVTKLSLKEVQKIIEAKSSN